MAIASNKRNNINKQQTTTNNNYMAMLVAYSYQEQVQSYLDSMVKEDTVHGLPYHFLASEGEGEIGEPSTDPCPRQHFLAHGGNRRRIIMKSYLFLEVSRAETQSQCDWVLAICILVYPIFNSESIQLNWSTFISAVWIWIDLVELMLIVDVGWSTITPLVCTTITYTAT